MFHAADGRGWNSDGGGHGSDVEGRRGQDFD
jgi:hypothetical protein